MKVKLHPLLLNSAIRLTALCGFVRKTKVATATVALLAVLATLLGAKVSSAQATGDIGLPIVFIHGI